MTLTITRQHELLVLAAPSTKPLVSGQAIYKCFKKQGLSAALIQLALARSRQWSEHWLFWRNAVRWLIVELSQLKKFDPQFLNQLNSHQSQELTKLASAFPLIRESENFNSQVFRRTLQDICDELAQSVLTEHSTIQAWLSAQGSDLAEIGRVNFHLADVKNNQNFPFAFMVTYSEAHGDNEIRHLPISQAILKYASTARHKLLNVVKPIHEAAQQLPWLAEMVNNKQLFAPSRWRPDEAWQLLQSVAVLRDKGIITKLPKWLNKNHSVTVSTKIETKQKRSFSADKLLDFQVELSLDGEVLSPEEREKILSQSHGLIFLKGKWVTADPNKLQKSLDYWQQFANANGQQLSFHEGLRLLAGLQPKNHPMPPHFEDVHQVLSGPNLEKVLAKLVDRSKLRSAVPKQLKATLRPYQRDGFRWLKFHVDLGLGACLADDMGLGKTLQVISLIASRPKKAKCSLIIVPASLLNNWREEFAKFAPHLKVKIYHSAYLKKPGEKVDSKSSSKSKGSSKSKKKEPFNWQDYLKDAKAIVTSYGMARNQGWLKENQWDLLVIDESQTIKNAKTKAAKAVKAIKAKSRIALTGTPIENNLAELWSLFDFIAPGILGSLNQFKGYIKAVEEHNFAPLRQLIKPYILRRLKTDKSIISDLPDKTEVKVYCGLSKQQIALYQQAVDQFKDDSQNPDLAPIARRGLVLKYLTRFKQICNHPDQWLGVNQYHEKASGKFLRLKEICEQIHLNGEKVLIFTQFKTLIKPIRELLATVFEHPGLELHGSVSVKKRQKVVTDFQRPDGPPFMVLSLKAGGTGLTLTQASHVIHFDRWWNPAVENQATDRAFRIGQKSNVLVHKMMTEGTLETRIDQMIEDKVELIENVLSKENGPSLTELNNDQLLQIFQLNVQSQKI